MTAPSGTHPVSSMSPPLWLASCLLILMMSTAALSSNEAVKCCIDIVATNKTEAPNGYVRLTKAGIGDSWELKQAGRYLATIDLETCTTTRRTYTEWESARLRTGDTLNKWKSSFFSLELSKMFGIDVAIGDGIGSYAPWIDIWELGVDVVSSTYGAQARSTNIKACMNGTNNHDVEFTDVVITWAS